MTEKSLLNEILLELPKLGVIAFRANSGTAWASNDITALPDGSRLLRNARPFTALMPGFSDIFGMVKGTGQFVAIEVKRPGQKPTKLQEHFINTIRASGGLAGVARSVEEAISILKGGEGRR